MNVLRSVIPTSCLIVLVLFYISAMAMDDIERTVHLEAPTGGVSGELTSLATSMLYNYWEKYTINSGAQVRLHAPVVELRDFHAKRGSQVVIGRPVIYLNFVVLNPSADVPDHDGLRSTCGQPEGCCPDRRPGNYHCIVDEDIHWLINSVNDNMINIMDGRMFDFRVSGISLYSDLPPDVTTYVSTDENKCDDLFYSITQSGVEYSASQIINNFNSCQDGPMRDSQAINVYIFDNGFNDNEDYGRGHDNNGYPLILVDFHRITGVDPSTGGVESHARPIEHELGHAFSLGHTCFKDISNGTPSNLMTSHIYCDEIADEKNKEDADYCPDLGGNRYGTREKGFEFESLLNCPDSSQENFMGYGQAETVYWHGMSIQQNLLPDFPF